MIKVNGRERKWEKDLTVDLLIKKCKYTFPLLLVKINGKFIPFDKEKYKDILIIDNDNVQVFYFIEGG